LRVFTTDIDATRSACEPVFDTLFVRWKYMGKAKEADGSRVLEYGVALTDAATPGTVTAHLQSLPQGAVRRVELKR
jgi:hypothetical protein